MVMYFILAIVCSLGYATASDVLDLKDGDFDSEVKSNEIILVEFYAPWCGHCKRLAPEYEKAATKLLKNDPPVPLAKVDCTSEKTVCDKFGVSGFPTLKIFRNGEFSADYGGPREADGIVKYMRGQVGPSSKELTSIKQFESFVDNEEHGIIGFFEKESRLRDSFHKVADTDRDRFRFAHTSSKELINKFGFNDDIVVFAPKRLHNKFEENYIKYTGNYDTEKIKKFLETEMFGLCGHRTIDNMAYFEKPLVVVYYNVDYVKDPKGTNYWRNRVLKVARGFRDSKNPEMKRVNFAISNREEFSQEIEQHGLEGTDSPKPMVAAQFPDGKFPMKDEFSPENLEKFVNDVIAGNVEAFMKSEDVPSSNDGPVKIVVAKNHKDIVNGEKDVLIEFYAPWCGHCKKLAPVFDELGEKLSKEDVIIAKMDATANDVPPAYSVSGFPTIYWVPKGKKHAPVPYNGGRDLKDFITFIAKEATQPLKKYDRDGKKNKKTEL